MITWKKLVKYQNEILKRKQSVTNLNETFIGKSGTMTNNKLEVANGFNDFFVNVGPKLANNIRVKENDASIYEYLRNPNSNTMFLKLVVEQEILGIVNALKNKTSFDCENLSMSTLKKNHA